MRRFVLKLLLAAAGLLLAGAHKILARAIRGAATMPDEVNDRLLKIEGVVARVSADVDLLKSQVGTGLSEEAQATLDRIETALHTVDSKTPNEGDETPA